MGPFLSWALRAAVWPHRRSNPARGRLAQPRRVVASDLAIAEPCDRGWLHNAKVLSLKFSKHAYFALRTNPKSVPVPYDSVNSKLICGL